MSAAQRRARRREIGLLGVLAVLALVAIPSPASSAGPVPGSAGTDTTLPATDSQVVARGRGPFAELEITLNQSKNLVNQAVSITWRGGAPTDETGSRFAANYLQIMQCWGDDDGTVPGNPGPPPEQCVQGAAAGVVGGLNDALFPSGFARSRIISRSTWANFDPAAGFLDTRTTNVWLPFRAVDGTVTDVHEDPEFNASISGGNYWLNKQFNIITTNEIAGAPTRSNGTGAELFEVHTGSESSGLGCGQKVQSTGGGEPRIPNCWLVVVPRGTAAAENVGTPSEGVSTDAGVVTSPVSPQAWQHRISFPLEFNPVDSACSLNDDDRRIVGGELVLAAVARWQPTLCATPGLPPYSYVNVGDPSARLQLSSPAPGGPGMIVVSRPLAAVNPANPVVYAPVSLSGVAIGFTVERNPDTDAPLEALALGGVRVAEMNLTPRLVAKLLTQSYRQQVTIQKAPPYQWLEGNPDHLGADPDFLQFNPEFDILQIANTRNFAGLVMPSGNSDAAGQVWEWVLADPEAKAWLDGAVDPWGMAVNPVYATVAAANSNGLPFGDPAPTTFPKSDPYCYQAPPRGPGGSLVPAPLCGTDWLPYSAGFREAARIGRAAYDGAKVVEDPNAVAADKVWGRDTPDRIGRRAILALTDSASAAQYGLQTARLSRAGDNGPDRRFIAPDAAGLVSGAASMAAREEPTVLEPSPSADAPAAYPLTALTYAAAAPLTLDEGSRADYAAFVEYASGPGQEPGLDPGLLPAGYAPMPDPLREQASDAVELLLDPEPLKPAAERAPEPPAALPPTTNPPAPRLAAAPDLVASPPPAVDLAAPSEPAAPSRAPMTRVSAPTAVVAPPEVTAGAAPLPVGTAAPVPRPSQVTPATAVGGSRLALVVLGIVALSSALGALEITKRPRRQPGRQRTVAANGIPARLRAALGGPR